MLIECDAKSNKFILTSMKIKRKKSHSSLWLLMFYDMRTNGHSFFVAAFFKGIMLSIYAIVIARK